MTDRERLIEKIKLSEKQELLDFLTADLDEAIDMSGGTQFNGTVEHLADYLLEHGVIVLPCKVGDILCCESVIKGHITYFEAPDLEWIVENRELFGKEIFFSGEEAEKALKEREQNERL